MPRQDLAALLLLSALWGGSFFFMRVAAPVLGPVLLVEARVLIAGLAMLMGAVLARSVPGLRSHWRPLFVLGVINSALPFVLISAAELRISASLAATLNATTPLFGAVVSALWLKESLTLRKVAGLMLGIGGVGVLVGLGPLLLSGDMLWAVGASLLAAGSYAIAAVYAKVKLTGSSPVAITTYSQLFAALALAPAVPFTLPDQAPTMPAIASTVALALLSTALGYFLYFRLIARVGPTKAMMVTYCSPAFGILWGTTLLGEPLKASMFVGFAMVLASVGLVARAPAGGQASGQAVARESKPEETLA